MVLAYAVRDILTAIIAVTMFAAWVSRRRMNLPFWLSLTLVGLLAVHGFVDQLNPRSDSVLGVYNDHMDVSANSVLAKTASDDKRIDSLWVTVRAAANLLAPLYMSPFEMDFDTLTGWFSALLCLLFAGAIILHVRRGTGSPIIDSTALAMFAFSTLAIGITGIIHWRYRSLVVPSLFVLGYRSLRCEWRLHGLHRLAIGCVAVPLGLVIIYRSLKIVLL
jgi:hypothetical protein